MVGGQGSRRRDRHFGGYFTRVFFPFGGEFTKRRRQCVLLLKKTLGQLGKRKIIEPCRNGGDGWGRLSLRG